MRVTNHLIVPAVQFASYFCFIFLGVAVPYCSAGLPTVGNVLHGEPSLRDDVIGRWAAAAAASAEAAVESAAAAAAVSRHAMAPPPSLLSSEKWRKRRANIEPKGQQDASAQGAPDDDQRFTPYVSVGVLSNLQNFFDVLRDNLDSLEAMSPEERAAVLSEMSGPDEANPNLAPVFDLHPPTSGSGPSNQFSLRTPHLPNATAPIAPLVASMRNSFPSFDAIGPFKRVHSSSSSHMALAWPPPHLWDATVLPSVSTRPWPLTPPPVRFNQLNRSAQRPSSTAAHIHAQRSGRPSPKTRQFVANSEPAFLRTTNLHDPGLLWLGLGRR